MRWLCLQDLYIMAALETLCYLKCSRMVSLSWLLWFNSWCISSSFLFSSLASSSQPKKTGAKLGSAFILRPVLNRLVLSPCLHRQLKASRGSQFKGHWLNPWIQSCVWYSQHIRVCLCWSLLIERCCYMYLQVCYVFAFTGSKLLVHACCCVCHCRTG